MSKELKAFINKINDKNHDGNKQQQTHGGRQNQPKIYSKSSLVCYGVRIWKPVVKYELVRARRRINILIERMKGDYGFVNLENNNHNLGDSNASFGGYKRCRASSRNRTKWIRDDKKQSNSNAIPNGEMVYLFQQKRKVTEIVKVERKTKNSKNVEHDKSSNGSMEMEVPVLIELECFCGQLQSVKLQKDTSIPLYYSIMIYNDDVIFLEDRVIPQSVFLLSEIEGMEQYSFQTAKENHIFDTSKRRNIRRPSQIVTV
mmetsp:Transcript_89/g.123  ORF Transcript_89/g.123 Transcript_89/m.123 type:complete len:258 (+) Transcript_89:3-776(+)